MSRGEIQAHSCSCLCSSSCAALVGEGKAVSVLLMSEVTGRLLLLSVTARRVLAIRGRRQLGARRREARTAATMTMARVAVERAKAALAVKLVCYVLGLTQGVFFIFHLLTKLFPSRDQPPIHLDHMTNHLTSHLTTHMTSHMPFQSPAPQSHLVLYHLLPSHLRIT